MGVDTIVLAEYQCEDLTLLPKMLSRCDAIFLKNIDVFWRPTPWSKKTPNLAWSWDEHADVDYSELAGPFGFHVLFRSEAVIEISASHRWHRFITDERVQKGVVAVCRVIGQVLGSTKLIYVPDSAYKVSGVFDELDTRKALNDIEYWLQEYCGDTAGSLRCIGSEPNNMDGYFIEPLEAL